MFQGELKTRLEAILQKTYDEHAVGDRPFGFDDQQGMCSYAAGCAIGISIPEELRYEVHNSSINVILHSQFEIDVAVTEALIGKVEDQEQLKKAADCLGHIQAKHDFAAKRDNKNGYRRELEGLAERYGLELKGAP